MLNYILSNTGILGLILIFNLLLTTAIVLYKLYFFQSVWPKQKKVFLVEMLEIYKNLNQKMSKTDIFKILEEKLDTKRNQIEKYLATLGTISSVSPLLGLLGTVLGMIESTKGILTIDNDLLLKGISNALITTAMGLVIAIPAIIFYNFFIDKIDKTIKEIKDKIISYLE